MGEKYQTLESGKGVDDGKQEKEQREAKAMEKTLGCLKCTLELCVYIVHTLYVCECLCDVCVW